MSIDYSSFAFPKGAPKVLERHRKQTAAEAALQRAYAKVDDRDKSVCWVTGVTLTPGAREAQRRREHHHLAGRRVKPEWREKPERIITVSAYVHELLTKHVLLAIGDDARKPIRFAWNPNMVSPGKEPFRLRPSVKAA